MYQFLTYPLDVIKTNRIVQSNMAREGVESVPREFMVLYEKGGLEAGAMRGFSVAAALAVADHINPTHGLMMSAPVVTAIQ